MSVSRVTVALAPRSGMLTLVLALAVLATCAGTAGAQESNGLWVAPERAARQSDPTPATANNIKGTVARSSSANASYATARPGTATECRLPI